MTPPPGVLAIAMVSTAMTLVAVSSGARPAHASAPAGEQAYNRVCRVCHGAAGRGDAAPRLVPFDRSVEELLGIVRDGRGDMPPQSQRTIADDEVTAVGTYLLSLRAPLEGEP